MPAFRSVRLMAIAALIGATASVAHAADQKSKPLDLTVRADTSVSSAPGQSRSLKWDAAKGRWGLTLNLEQADTRESTWNDVQAGAYYRITPSLRVGGAVALGDQQFTRGAKKITPDQGQPRVRLETAFKF